MSSGHVQVAPDGSGKDIDTDALVSDESQDTVVTVYRQDVVVADPTVYKNKAGVTASKALKVAITDDPDATFRSTQVQLLTDILEELRTTNKVLAKLARPIQLDRG